MGIIESEGRTLGTAEVVGEIVLVGISDGPVVTVGDEDGMTVGNEDGGSETSSSAWRTLRPSSFKT